MIDMAVGFVVGVAVGLFAAVAWAAWTELEKLSHG